MEHAGLPNINTWPFVCLRMLKILLTGIVPLPMLMPVSV